MRRLAFIAFLLLSSLAQASALERARLFDWYYPAEPAYKLLFELAQKGNRAGWLVAEMRQGKPVPQASARELALDLQGDSVLSEDDKKNLKAAFAPENLAVGQASGTQVQSVDEVAAKFAQLNERMTALEDILKSNHFNKQTYPGVSAVLKAAYLNPGGTGLLSGVNGGFFAGGVNITFDGQGNGGGFTFGLGQTFRRDFVYELVPTSTDVGTYSSNNPSFTMGYGDGAISVDLAKGHTLFRSALALGVVAAPGAPNSFNVNFEGDDGGRPAYSTGELKVGLPAAGKWIDSLAYFRKQGANKFWPFTDFELFWGPEEGYARGYNLTKMINWGVSASTDLGPLWGLVDHSLLYGDFNGQESDRDLLRGFNLQDNPTSTMAWAVGTETLTRWGGQFFLEYGQSQKSASTSGIYKFNNTNNNTAFLQGYKGVQIDGFERRYSGDAMVASYVQPFSVLTLGLEYSKVSPLFTPPFGAVKSMIITGTDSDPGPLTTNTAGRITPWPKPPLPGGYVDANKRAIIDSDRDITFGSDLSSATGLMSNTEKGVLQGQVAWSWLSLGFFGGVASQTRSTGPWLKTQSRFESGNGSFMLYNRFGGSYWLPPDPFTTQPPPTLTNFPGTLPNWFYYQWGFNRPADGVALFNGAPLNVHWNALAQIQYQNLDYYVIFSKNGVGDNNVDGFSQKYINYLAGTMKFDLQSLFGRIYPLELVVSGESRDLSGNAGLTRFGDPGQAGSADMIYFNQAYFNAFARYGFNSILTLVGIYGHEEWHSNHSFYPICTQANEWGGGFDIDAAAVLTGLGIFMRSRILNFSDSNIGQREMSVWETDLGTSISF